MEPLVREFAYPVESSATEVNNINKKAIPGTGSSETLFGGDTEDLTQLPKMDIADLEHIDFVRQFKLVHSSPTNFGLSPISIVTIPPYMKDLLDDHQLATNGAPTNKALVKCRVEIVILITLAHIKHHSHSRAMKLLDVQFDCEIHLAWKINRKNFNLSGTVDYSLWDGKPSECVTNTVVVKTETTACLQRGMYQCLTYMGVPDTSIFGIATDGFEWIVIRIRPDGHYATKSYQWATESVEIVSMLYMIFNHAVGIKVSTSHKKWKRLMSSSSSDKSDEKAPWRKRK
ncbi:uncharacterized protein N7515_009620 [Penicillium bovifimosum]|uniref:Uncharacterized protein n=1 Tax=Penicillium bovifimosum TaxID=126998 RepID=A0A9W9KVV1_9EURO|nr:uncharacterized protein N7515_009620 [Penicillium bovifimosum]KAJ5121659.1 hypothetical protein N7515_009620 [Penicillium bovifimosum]